MAHVRLLVQTSSSLTLSGSGQIKPGGGGLCFFATASATEGAHAAAHHHLSVANGQTVEREAEAYRVRARTAEHVRRIAITADRKRRAAARPNLQRHFGRRALARFGDGATRGGV